MECWKCGYRTDKIYWRDDRKLCQTCAEEIDKDKEENKNENLDFNCKHCGWIASCN